MQRENTKQYGRAVNGSVTNCEDLDYRAMAGGRITIAEGGGNGGLYAVWSNINGKWKPYAADGSVVELDIDQNTIARLPEAMFDVGVFRLVGPVGKVDLETKS